jgi:hypothetical protein
MAPGEPAGSISTSCSLVRALPRLKHSTAVVGEAALEDRAPCALDEAQQKSHVVQARQAQTELFTAAH